MRPQCGVRRGCQFSLFFSTTHYFCVTKITVHSLKLKFLELNSLTPLSLNFTR